MTSSTFLHLSLLRWVFIGVRASGATDAELIRESGWAPIDDPDAQVPCTTATALIEGAIRLTNDPAFGLHAARTVHRDGMGQALVCCCSAARSPQELLRHTSRYLSLHRSTMGLEAETTEDTTIARLQFSPPSLDRAARAATEFALGVLALALRDAAQGEKLLKAVHFRHTVPPFRAEYDELFGCPVKFGAPNYQLEIALPESIRKRGNSQLPPWVAEQAEGAISRLPPLGPMSASVRSFIASQLPWGIPSMTQTAVGVSESVQSLYERLLPEGTAFAVLREELLSELASAYLKDPSLSTPEVAHLLGFIDFAVFERAFERWVGMAPRVYRSTGKPTS